jgi:hypothetical protein
MSFWMFFLAIAVIYGVVQLVFPGIDGVNGL